MKAFLLTVFFGFLFLDSPKLALASETDKPRICYFQLTPSKEGETLKSDIAAITDQVEVRNYQIGDKPPNTAFENMIIEDMKKKSGKCNSLALSSHHAGDFASETKGVLELQIIEKLSCNPKYKDWFSNIKALYLHGCNTVKDKYLQGIRDKTQAVTDTGDKLSVRKNVVGQLNINQDNSAILSTMNHAYAATLDEHTPLSSRYMRAFPNTSIYGFAKKAKESAGHRDILKHISNVANALRADSRKAEEAVTADEFLTALNAITTDICDKIIKSWEQVDPEAAAAVANKDHSMARKLGCDLIINKQVLDDSNSTDTERNDAKTKIKKTLQKIIDEDQKNSANADNKDLSLSDLLMNNIYDTVNLANDMAVADYGHQDTQFIKEVENILKQGSFKSALENKMNSPILSSIKKVDYIKLYQRLSKNSQGTITDEDQKTIDDAVSNLVANVIQKASNNNNQKILRLLLTDQLFQYDLLTTEQIIDIADNQELFSKDSTDNWPKSIKWKLGYKSYGLTEESNRNRHSFNAKLNQNIHDPGYVQAVTPEILKDNNLKTTFRLTKAIPFSSKENSIAFTNKLKKHIQNTPTGKSRLQIVKDYFANSQLSSDELDKGENNFQTHLLAALWNLDEKEFEKNPEAYGGAKSRKEFFDKLDSATNESDSAISTMISSPANKDTLQAIKDALNQ